MPTEEVKAAIVELEIQVKHFEKLFANSMIDDEVYAKSKIILQHLKKASQELNELKKIKEIK